MFACHFEELVAEGGLAVIDVGDDAKVADAVHRERTRVDCRTRHCKSLHPVNDHYTITR